MKIKTHILQFATALCALAFFSFTAQAGNVLVVQSVPPVAAVNDSDTTGKAIQPAPVPPSPAPVDNGTYSGTVMID